LAVVYLSIGEILKYSVADHCVQQVTCALILSETLALNKSFTYLLTYLHVDVIDQCLLCLSICSLLSVTCTWIA